jgi:Phage tail tube protein FII
MSVNAIPEKIVNFNIYDEGDRLVGISGEIKLPKLEGKGETISGAGIAGEFDSQTPGHFSNIDIDIPFQTVLDESFSLMAPEGKTIILRGSQQSYDVSAGTINYVPLKITLKVVPKSLDLGTLGVAKKTDTKNTMTVLYIKVDVDGKTKLELDKLNFIYKVDGTDVFETIRKQI